MNYFEPRTKPASPTTVVIPPPIKSQMALSVGSPVKSLEKSLRTESDAMNPKTSNTTPTTRRMREMSLLKRCSVCWLESASSDFATTDDTHQDQHDGDDQENVDESADGVGRNESQQPEDQKDDGDRVEHVL